MGYELLLPLRNYLSIKLTIFAVSLEGSAIFSTPRDRVATYNNITFTVVPSACMRRMAGSITHGSVEHIHTRWTRYAASKALRPNCTKLTSTPERTKSIRHVISLDTWHHPEPHGQRYRKRRQSICAGSCETDRPITNTTVQHSRPRLWHWHLGFRYGKVSTDRCTFRFSDTNFALQTLS